MMPSRFEELDLSSEFKDNDMDLTFACLNYKKIKIENKMYIKLESGDLYEASRHLINEENEIYKRVFFSKEIKKKKIYLNNKKIKRRKKRLFKKYMNKKYYYEKKVEESSKKTKTSTLKHIAVIIYDKSQKQTQNQKGNINNIIEDDIHIKTTSKKEEKSDVNATNKLFIVEKKDEENAHNKFYKEKRNSRTDNISLNILTEFCQIIIPDWINNNEAEEENQIKKLDPKMINEFKNIRNQEIGDIYKSDINLKVKIDRSINKRIIENAEGIKKNKLKLTLQEAYNLFYDSKKRESFMIKKVPEFAKLNQDERKNYIKKFFDGLIDSEEYFNRKKIKDEIYNQNLKKMLEKLYQKE